MRYGEATLTSAVSSIVIVNVLRADERANINGISPFAVETEHIVLIIRFGRLILRINEIIQ